MKRLLRKLKSEARETGQSIVIIAAAFIGLIAFVGLAVDGGTFYIAYGHLRRSADAAALAAADQYRRGYDMTKLQTAAAQYLRLNSIDVTNTTAEIYTCHGTVSGGTTIMVDATLCTNPARKLVRVVAHGEVKFSFLPIIGLSSARIEADAVGEAATLDIVLVIDTSESMTWYDPDTGVPFDSFASQDEADKRDMSICNSTNSCHPFEEVRSAAKQVIDFALTGDPTEEENRVALVYFNNGWQKGAGQNMGTDLLRDGSITNLGVPTGWFKSNVDATAALNSLTVYDPGGVNSGTTGYAKEAGRCPDDFDETVYTTIGTCRNYFRNDPGWDTKGCTSARDTSCPDAPSGYVDSHVLIDHYAGIGCYLGKRAVEGGYDDWSTCGTTNIGGGLKLGGSMFGVQPNMDSIWVVILITDGSANATCLDEDENVMDCTTGRIASEIQPHIAGHIRPILDYCPFAFDSDSPKCQDTDATTHHLSSAGTDYDADDYARDAARFVGCEGANPAAGCLTTKGQGAYIYTIGLGPGVLLRDGVGGSGSNAYGDSLLRYIAAAGYKDDVHDHDPSYDPCAGVPLPDAITTSNPIDPLNPRNYSCGNYYYVEKGHDLSTVIKKITSTIYTRIQR
jgi:Flp pilus assembly protein TadG